MNEIQGSSQVLMEKKQPFEGYKTKLVPVVGKDDKQLGSLQIAQGVIEEGHVKDMTALMVNFFPYGLSESVSLAIAPAPIKAEATDRVNPRIKLSHTEKLKEIEAEIERLKARTLEKTVLITTDESTKKPNMESRGVTKDDVATLQKVDLDFPILLYEGKNEKSEPFFFVEGVQAVNFNSFMRTLAQLEDENFSPEKKEILFYTSLSNIFQTIEKFVKEYGSQEDIHALNILISLSGKVHIIDTTEVPESEEKNNWEKWRNSRGTLEEYKIENTKSRFKETVSSILDSLKNKNVSISTIHPYEFLHTDVEEIPRIAAFLLQEYAKKYNLTPEEAQAELIEEFNIETMRMKINNMLPQGVAPF